MKVVLYTFWLILQSPATSQDKVMTIYQLTRCEELEITASIIVFESGHLKAYKLKIDNAQKYNNLFGFFYKGKYIKFNSYADGVRYYQKWQQRWWIPFHKKYPNKTYYQFLEHRGYCSGMPQYLRVIKRIESLDL